MYGANPPETTGTRNDRSRWERKKNYPHGSGGCLAMGIFPSGQAALTGPSSMKPGRTGAWRSTPAPVGSCATTRGAEPSLEQRRARSRSCYSTARRFLAAATPHRSSDLQPRTRSGRCSSQAAPCTARRPGRRRPAPRRRSAPASPRTPFGAIRSCSRLGPPTRPPRGMKIGG